MVNPSLTANLTSFEDVKTLAKDCIEIAKKCSPQELKSLNAMWIALETLETDIAMFAINTQEGRPFRVGDYTYVRYTKETL